MDLYMKYVESGGTDHNSKNKIIVYNEDDCFATMHIYDWVMAQQRGPRRANRRVTADAQF